MAFKGWDNISINQRKRYERKGVTRETYDAIRTKQPGAPKDLTMARGHHISLPHNKPVRDARKERARQRVLKAMRELGPREKALGYYASNDLIQAVGSIGPEGARIIVEWHEYKFKHGVKGSDPGRITGGLDENDTPLPKFREYVDAHYPGLWNDVYEDYWSEAQEIEGNGYYN